MSAEAETYLFEKVYLQCAHISILEEALAEAKLDLTKMAKQKGYEHLAAPLADAIEKIDIAYKSIAKLKNESAK